MKVIDDIGIPPYADAIRALIRRPSDRPTLTELVAPTRLSALRRQHFDEIEVKASDMLYILDGQAMHAVLAAGASQDALVEERLNIQLGADFITGGVDIYSVMDGGILADHKRTNTHAVRDGIKFEWIVQLNGYALGLIQAGFKVARLVIVAWYRNWSRTGALRGDMPRSQLETFDIPIWPAAKTEAYFSEKRAALDVAMRATSSKEMPLCTPEERWTKKTTWAVKKSGRDAALRVQPTEQEARQWMATKGRGDSIEHRPGEETRCAHYCHVAKWCDFGARHRITEPPPVRLAGQELVAS